MKNKLLTWLGACFGKSAVRNEMRTGAFVEIKSTEGGEAPMRGQFNIKVCYDRQKYLPINDIENKKSFLPTLKDRQYSKLPQPLRRILLPLQ